MGNRTKVFISYSHRDDDYLERLKVFIKPLERNHSIDFWDDTKIRSGSRWREEIANAIAESKVAVLLISADFVASDFITQDELPPLLKAAENEGAVILPVYIGLADLTGTGLADFQGVNDPRTPLKEIARNKRERVFFDLSQRIREIFQSTPTPIPQTTFQEIIPLTQQSSNKRAIELPVRNIIRQEPETRFLAEFVRNADGQLRRTGKNKNHFEIRLFIENAPPETKQVVYELHDTYPKPIREVPKGRRDFEEFITSYGDYVVNIEILGDRILEMNDWLSSALENFYGKNPSRDVFEAIKSIEEH